MYLKVLDNKRQELIKDIANKANIEQFYLAGGTALSLQYGLRESVDFDFFTPESFDVNGLYEDMKLLYPDMKTLKLGDRTLDLEIDNVQVSFFNYPYKMLDKFVSDEKIPKLKMAGIRDIAAMKLSAIGSRGERKDFYDFYHICKISGLKPEDIPVLLRDKFGDKSDFSYIYMGLNYFEDAEHGRLPKTFVPENWKEIKAFFEDFSQKIVDSSLREKVVPAIL